MLATTAMTGDDARARQPTVRQRIKPQRLVSFTAGLGFIVTFWKLGHYC